MNYYVYLLLTKSGKNHISYVGYTSNLINRLKKHNSSNGAKFTKGRKWKVIYSKKYNNKSTALKEEYKLKKDYKKRKIIINNYLSKNEKAT
tara:strand:+ start:1153 stop:1425 length:273 start_codon:yes stop_codon:yes gene_type:complete